MSPEDGGEVLGRGEPQFTCDGRDAAISLGEEHLRSPDPQVGLISSGADTNLPRVQLSQVGRRETDLGGELREQYRVGVAHVENPAGVRDGWMEQSVPRATSGELAGDLDEEMLRCKCQAVTAQGLGCRYLAEEHFERREHGVRVRQVVGQGRLPVRRNIWQVVEKNRHVEAGEHEVPRLCCGLDHVVERPGRHRQQTVAGHGVLLPVHPPKSRWPVGLQIELPLGVDVRSDDP